MQFNSVHVAKSDWIPLLLVALLIITSFVIFRDMEVYFTEKLHALVSNKPLFAILSFLILLSDIVLPVPSSIVMYLNGFALGVAGGALLSIAALMISATLGYMIGSISSRGKKIADETNSGFLISKYGAIAILMTRGIPVLSESICIVCGYQRIPFRNYLILNLIGYLPLCILYASFGHWGFNKDMFLLSFSAAIVVSALFWFFGRFMLTQTMPE